MVEHRCRHVWFAALVLLSLGVVASQASAASFTTYVGYADDLRPSPFFPTPWSGGANVALFAGGGANFDAGAVRIDNIGAAAFTINALTVTMMPTASPSPISIWGAYLPFVLQPGKTAIFTQTSQYNFDTSEYELVARNLANNCSIGAVAATAVCVNNAPSVAFTIDGAPLAFSDTAHVLDTGGFDLAAVINPQEGQGYNESLQWRRIGTTGVENPGGEVPEPTTLLLLGSGLAFGVARRRRG